MQRLDVNILTVAGALESPFCCKQISTHLTFAQLKHTLSTHYNIPAIFQRLIVAETVPDDHETLGLYASKEAHGSQELILTLLLSLEVFDDPRVQVRRVAVNTLDKLAQKGDMRAIAALQGGIGDVDAIVRLRCLKTMRNIAEKGNAIVLATAKECLEDSHAGVRRAAVELLQAVADVGDKLVISAVCAVLDDAHEVVRRAALEALSLIAEKGDDEMIGVLVACIDDPDAGVRRSVLAAVCQLAEIGDSRVLVAARPYLCHANSLVRSAASSLIELMKHGDIEAALDEPYPLSKSGE